MGQGKDNLHRCPRALQPQALRYRRQWEGKHVGGCTKEGSIKTHAQANTHPRETGNKYSIMMMMDMMIGSLQ